MRNTKKLYIVTSLIFTLLAAWWGYLAITGGQGTNKPSAEVFAAAYGLMALYGGIVGLFVSKRWGGFKSLIGKATGFIALGLLAQEFGQLAYSYLGTKMEEVPYPSIGDVGYFGSIILYVIGLVFLIRALRVKGSFTNARSLLAIVLIPITLLVGSYEFFLRNYEADMSQKLVVFLDFGYPLGQAFYVALALLAYVLSRKYLGGVMKPVIIFLIIALFSQYAADFTFLYTNYHETWQAAGINDLMYLASYFFMTMALLKFGGVIDKLGAGSGEGETE